MIKEEHVEACLNTPARFMQLFLLIIILLAGQCLVETKIRAVNAGGADFWIRFFLFNFSFSVSDLGLSL